VLTIMNSIQKYCGYWSLIVGCGILWDQEAYGTCRRGEGHGDRARIVRELHDTNAAVGKAARR